MVRTQIPDYTESGLLHLRLWVEGQGLSLARAAEILSISQEKLLLVFPPCSVTCVYIPLTLRAFVWHYHNVSQHFRSYPDF